jgi:hypothetical protein
VSYDRRTFLKIAAGGAAAAAAVGGPLVYRSPRAREIYVRLMRPRVDPRIANPPGTEVLYNGIQLPSPWPPFRRQLEGELEFPPYLQKPPEVIPIDVGRQLFVDDFLIEESSLDRSYHSASYIDGNPVLAPATEWDKKDGPALLTNRPQRPTAMPFSDGVWFDPNDQKFKIWYTAGYGRVTCYAESADGLEWIRPPLDVIPGTNIVLDEIRDSSTVWLDLDEPNPHLRYKMLIFLQNIRHLRQFVSPDGIHWTPAGLMGPSGDRTTMFYNPFRKVWVYSLRNHQGQESYLGRHRRYVESKHFCSLTPWTTGDAVAWLAADDLDRPRVDIGFQPQLYNLDCVAYESVLLGLFSATRAIGRSPITSRSVSAATDFTGRVHRAIRSSTSLNAPAIGTGPTSNQRVVAASSSAIACSSTSAVARESPALTARARVRPGLPPFAATGSPRSTHSRIAFRAPLASRRVLAQ